MAEADFNIANYRKFLAQRKLMACRCPDCGQIFLPPRPICPISQSQNMQWVELSGQGEIVAFTSIAVVPAAKAQLGYGRKNPYVSGFVSLKEGPTVPCRIERTKYPLRVGTPVKADFMDDCAGKQKQVTLVFRSSIAPDG